MMLNLIHQDQSVEWKSQPFIMVNMLVNVLPLLLLFHTFLV